MRRRVIHALRALRALRAKQRRVRLGSRRRVHARPSHVVLLCVIAAGCIRDADPFDVDAEPLQVHAVLVAGSDSATVLVSRPARSGSPVYQPVRDADVRLTHAGETVQLSERPAHAACVLRGRSPVGGGTGCYTAVLPRRIAAGAVYDLEVLLPGGGRASGRTRVPDAVTITAPDDSKVYTVVCAGQGAVCQPLFSPGPGAPTPLVTIELQWTPPSAAARVDVLLRLVRAARGTHGHSGTCAVEPLPFDRHVEAPDGIARWQIDSISCQFAIQNLAWDTIYMTAAVSVYDAAYSTYIGGIFDRDAARIESVGAGITGALGVFGAVNPTVRDIVLVRQ